MSKNNYWLIIAIICLAALSRLVKHPFNFTPIIAMSIFSGYYLKKWWGVLIPLLAMVASDYFLGFYELPLMLSVYAGIACSYFLSLTILKEIKWHRVLGTSLLSSVIFFIVTNFTLWQATIWYPHTWAGLVDCFTLAVPFFRNSLAGDLIYTTIFFLAYKFANDYVLAKLIAKKATI